MVDAAVLQLLRRQRRRQSIRRRLNFASAQGADEGGDFQPAEIVFDEGLWIDIDHGEIQRLFAFGQFRHIGHASLPLVFKKINRR